MRSVGDAEEEEDADGDAEEVEHAGEDAGGEDAVGGMVMLL